MRAIAAGDVCAGTRTLAHVLACTGYFSTVRAVRRRRRLRAAAGGRTVICSLRDSTLRCRLCVMRASCNCYTVIASDASTPRVYSCISGYPLHARVAYDIFSSTLQPARASVCHVHNAACALALPAIHPKEDGGGILSLILLNCAVQLLDSCARPLHTIRPIPIDCDHTIYDAASRRPRCLLIDGT
eukprot:IDg12486t1